MALSGLLCAIGMFLFGHEMAVGANAALCSFLMGVMMLGVIIGIWSTISYGLDAFRNLSSEMFVMNMLFKVRFLRVFFFEHQYIHHLGPAEDFAPVLSLLEGRTRGGIHYLVCIMI